MTITKRKGNARDTRSPRWLAQLLADLSTKPVSIASCTAAGTKDNIRQLSPCYSLRCVRPHVLLHFHLFALQIVVK